ncbi:hypothetical protein O3M35_008634 [Rhynocoris fuscipes]|uniref:Uncharacterized protein n=1 Tax=Rhynocoris fuscipes TaxID=488301 RepID=A0AAW1DCL7_9HEMI
MNQPIRCLLFITYCLTILNVAYCKYLLKQLLEFGLNKAIDWSRATTHPSYYVPIETANGGRVFQIDKVAENLLKQQNILPPDDHRSNYNNAMSKNYNYYRY